MLPLLNNLVGIFWARFSMAHIYFLTQMVPPSPPPPFVYVIVPGIVWGWSGERSSNYFYYIAQQHLLQFKVASASVALRSQLRL